MILALFFAVIALFLAIVTIKRLNRTYFLLSLSKRVKTVDGSSLKDKICTIPGKTPFGNNFDILDETPESIFEQQRRWCRYAKGGSYLLHFLFNPVYNVTNAEDAEEVLQSQTLITKNIVYELLKPFLGVGLLISTDQQWHFRRKMLTPAFHFNILQNFLDIFKEESYKFIKNLDRQLEETIELVNLIPQFTLNNVCETALGVKLDNIPGSVEYRHVIHQLEVIIVQRSCNPLLFFPFIFNYFGKGKQHEECLKILHAFSSKIIEAKRKAFKERKQMADELQAEQSTSTNENKEETDQDIYGVYGRKKRYAMLDTLLEAESKGLIDHEGICDEVNTFMFEGYDTTSTCLIFTIFNLAVHPDIQERCYNEVKQVLSSVADKVGKQEKSSVDADIENLTIFDLNKLEYLECCIKESLRLYPPVPFAGRKCTQETCVNGLILPEGAQVNVHIYDIMRDPRHFKNPDAFEPERFLPENTTHRHPFAFVPFSAGPRNCIGQKFAIQEMKVLLMSIIRNFEILPVTRLDEIILENGIVLRAQKQVKVKFSRRK